MRCGCEACLVMDMILRLSAVDRKLVMDVLDRGDDLNAPPVDPIGQATDAEDGMSIGELEAESIRNL